MPKSRVAISGRTPAKLHPVQRTCEDTCLLQCDPIHSSVATRAASLCSGVWNVLKAGRNSPATRPSVFLGIGNLKRQAVLAQFLPALSPRLMLGALCVIRRRFGAGELNGINAVEVADLIPLRFQPDIFDPGNLRGQRLDALDGLILII